MTRYVSRLMFSLDRTFIVCEQRGWVVGMIFETGGYSLRHGFLTKDSKPFTVETNHVSPDRNIEVHHFATSIRMVRSLSFL